MIRPNKSTKSKIAFGLALGAVGLSLGWVRSQQAGLPELRGATTNSVQAGAPYVGQRWPAADTGETTWPAAPEQSSGGGWRYEIFTPPVITYNPFDGTFAVSPLDFPVAQPSFAQSRQELLAVKPEPYRLQLLGYVGRPGDYQVAFGGADSPEQRLVRPGYHFDQLALTLKSFDVRLIAREGNEAGPVYEVIAVAVLQDELSGTEVVLDSRSRKMTDTLVAYLKSPGAGENPRAYHVGDTFFDEGTTCRVEHIQLDPAEVVLTRTRAGQPGSERHVLQIANQPAAKSLSAQSNASQPAQVTVTAGK